MEQRNIGVGELVHAVDRVQPHLGQRGRDRVVQRLERHDPRVVMTVPDGQRLTRDRSRQRTGIDEPEGRCIALGSNAATRLRADTRERQQPVGHIEDRRRHAIADRQVGHFGCVGMEQPDHVAPVALPRRCGALGEIAEDRHRPTRAAPADAAQCHRAVVLRFVDHDVSVDERRADEQRVRFVDEELIRHGPSPALATRTGEQLVDEPDGLCGRPRPGERRAQLRSLLPHVVTVVAAQHVALHHSLQRVAPLVHR